MYKRCRYKNCSSTLCSIFKRSLMHSVYFPVKRWYNRITLSSIRSLVNYIPYTVSSKVFQGRPVYLIHAYRNLIARAGKAVQNLSIWDEHTWVGKYKSKYKRLLYSRYAEFDVSNVLNKGPSSERNEKCFAYSATLIRCGSYTCFVYSTNQASTKSTFRANGVVRVKKKT